LGVDPLGGAGVHYWSAIAERYGIDLTVVDETVDPTFRFMTLDWDGRIRMDPSSIYTMQRLIGLKDRFQVAWGCDTDHDRHGIVTRRGGLLPPNHYLAVCVFYLFQNRPRWPRTAAVGKTLVSSHMIDRVAAKLGRKFTRCRWVSSGLWTACWTALWDSVAKRAPGASFLRMDGTAWSTDKDGIIACLLAAEITAREGRDPG
jgi:phosphoglucomutase